MSLRCPQCGKPVSVAKTFWFVRLVSFSCISCNAKLALAGDARTILVVTGLASVVISYVVKASMESDTPAIIVFIAGLAVSCGLTWKMGSLVVVEDEATGESR